MASVSLILSFFQVRRRNKLVPLRHPELLLLLLLLLVMTIVVIAMAVIVPVAVGPRHTKDPKGRG
jgi:hypothetical protein